MKEWDEEKLNAELKALMEEMPKDDDLEKRIEQNIKKKVRKIVIRTVAAMTGVVLLLVLIINPLMNAAYLNPYKLNQEPKRQMYTTLRNYWETMQPYTEIVSLNVQKKGFARYTLEMQVANHREQLILSNANVWMDMEFGTYKNQRDEEGRLVYQLGRFSDEVTKEDKEQLITELKELPQSAEIYLSIGEKEPKALSALRQEAIGLEWIEVYQPNLQKESGDAFQGGLSMQMHVISGWTDDMKSRDEMTEEELKEVYVANLKDLTEHVDLWKQFGVASGNTTYFQGEDLIKECYEDAKKLDTLESRNYCIFGKRDEVVAYLEKTDLTSLRVDDVRLSSLK